MASRRTRIKGIANIPQRKKINQDNNVSNVDTSNNDNTSLSGCNIKAANEEEISENISTNTVVDSSTNSFVPVEELSLTTQNINTEIASKDPLCNDINFRNALETSTVIAQSTNFCNLNATEDVNNVNNEVLCTDIVLDTAEGTSNQFSKFKNGETKNEKSSMLRRKFLKPGINLSAIKKRHTTKETSEVLQTTENTLPESDVKEDISDINKDKETNLKSPEKALVINEISIPKYGNKLTPVARDLTKMISSETNEEFSDPGTYSEVTLNETHLYANDNCVLNSPVVTFSPRIKKVVPDMHNVSDSEYPAPPPSPSKINRSRIKAIPRLSQRKTSCSASESEDESRKYGRIRNNSVCSVISTHCLEPPTPTSETVQSKDVTPVIQKKVSRTEQSRKLAEARREFQKRFGSNSPDKQRLKMIDLIFYNPTTNPMSQICKEKNTTEMEKESEESIDDPSKVAIAEDKEKENGSDSGMPVPQIKIGPSGEIILDEQSLIVENSEIARQKEQIRNSKTIDGDIDTGYGIYKRAPRALAWSQKETLRFYKALNLIGTDFTVMTQLFPKRNRRELKMKFKKEEKINKHLIDKAIMQPCRYNFADLKREIEIEEEEEAALQKLKEEEMKKLEEIKQQKRDKRRKDKEAKISNNLSEPNDDDEEPGKDTIILPPKKRLKSLQKPVKIKSKPRKIKTKPLNINSVLDDDSDADISDMETQSESEEEETIPFLKPTRSGRIPKSTMRLTTIVDQVSSKFFDESIIDISGKKLYQPSSDLTKICTTSGDPPPTQLSQAIRNRRSSSISSIESNSEKLVPGSLVIMTEEDSNGKVEYKVFMVTPEKKMTSLALDSDLVARLVSEKQSEEDNAKFLVPPVPEKNITIPASGEVVLRNCSNEIAHTTE